ncbi:MAG: pyridoxamine 5'-phosphate oxidase family protein [Pseudomonadota bacterium]
MRRSDLEVQDLQAIQTSIGRCRYCRLGLVEHGMAYIVPLNFGYAFEDGKHLLYFHSALEGRKIRLLQENPQASFQMDANYKMYSHEIACEYSARYQSIIGHGSVHFIQSPEDKIRALRTIMLHNTKTAEHTFSNAMLERVAVFCLTVDELTCKAHA